MGRTQKNPLVPSPSESEIDSSALGLSAASLEAEAKKALSPLQLSRLKKIAYYLSKVGLPLSEACTLVDVDFEKFQEEMKLNPIIGKVIRMKELEFKKDMMHVVAMSARSGDDKMAMALLEKKFPDEFGTAKRRTPDGEGQGDMILEAIRVIRRGGDASPLVSDGAGQSIVVKRESASKGVYERIGDILGNSTPSRLIEAEIVSP